MVKKKSRRSRIKKNDCKKYKELYKYSTIRFEHIAHCAEKSIFKDNKLY